MFRRSTPLARLDASAVAALLLLAVAPATARGAESIFSAYRTRHLDGPAVSIDRPVEVAIGHLAVTLSSGTAYRVRAGNGRPVGWFFRGEGRYVYRTEDPADQAVFEANVRAASGSLDPTGMAVGDRFGEMILLTVNRPIDPLETLPATGPAADGSVTAAYDRFEQALALSDFAFDHIAARNDANHLTGESYLYAEFDGKNARIAYTHDRSSTWMERLFTFRKFSGVEYRYSQTLSRQMLPERGEQLAQAVLTHVDVKITSDDNTSARVVADLTFHIARDGVRLLEFSLVNNRDAKTERWESDRRALHVRRVRDGDGDDLDFSHRYHEIAIDLGKPYSEGDELTIHFEADGDFVTDSGGGTSDNIRDLSDVDWLPMPFSTAERRFTLELEARCKPPFVPVATGDTTFFGTEDGYNVLRSVSNRPLWIPALFFGKFKVHETEVDGRTIRVFGYGIKRDKDLEQIAQLSGAYLAFYSNLLVPYPWKELDIVELPTMAFFGVSPSGLVLLTTRSMDHADPVMREFLGNRGVNALIAHEMAHQWFGHVEWPLDPFVDNWLTESLAEYVSGLLIAAQEQQLRSEGKFVKSDLKSFRDLHAEWWRFAKEVAGRGTIRGANRLSGDLAGAWRFYLLYCRGPLVLHQLRTLVGDQRFVAILKTFLEDADFGPVDADDFAHAASEVIGSDMSWYFEQWLDQSTIPEVHVEHRVTPNGSGAVLSGVVRQEGPEFYKLHVPLILEMPNGRREVRLVFQQQPVQEFSFTLPAAPRRVLVDPAGNNLATYR